MGRSVQYVSQMASVLDDSSDCSTATSFTIRNTFLELKAVEPPASQKPVRARTAPEHGQSANASSPSSATATPSCSRCVSGENGVEQDSSSCSSTTCDSIASSTTSPEPASAQPVKQLTLSPLDLLLPGQRSSCWTSSATSSCSGISSSEDVSAYEEETPVQAPQLCIKNTFLEVVASSRAPPRRSKSMPPSDLSEAEEHEQEPDKEHEDNQEEEGDVMEHGCGLATPTGDDSPRLHSSVSSSAFFAGAAPPMSSSSSSFNVWQQAAQVFAAPSSFAPTWTMMMQPPVVAAPPSAAAEEKAASDEEEDESKALQQQKQQKTQQKQQVQKQQQKQQVQQSAEAAEQQPSTTSRKAKREVAKAEQQDAKSASNADAASKRRQKTGPAATDKRASDLIEEACRASMEQSRSPVWSLARKDSNSSLLVQKAIGIVAQELQEAEMSGDQKAIDRAGFRVEALLVGMHGHVRTALEHPHANYVVQKAAEVLPTEYLSFMVTELKGKVLWASLHRFGCRTLLRLVSHCRSAGWVGSVASQLVDELLPHSYELTCDQFGNYVMQEVLEHGYPHQRHAVAQALLHDGLRDTAATQQGSRVVEKALRMCDADDVRALADALLRDRGLVATMASTEHGCLVLKPLLKSEQHSRRTASILQPLASELRKTRQGRRLLGPVLGNSQAAWE